MNFTPKRNEAPQFAGLETRGFGLARGRMERSDGEGCRVELEKDFYNAVAALLPLLMLTKVVDRHRRQHMRKLDTPEASHDTNKQRTEQYRHRAFLFLAALTEALALLGAAWKHDDTVLNWLLLGMVAFCGIFFTIELALGKLVEE